MRLIDALEDNDDVQDVYANFDIPEQVLEAVDRLAARRAERQERPHRSITSPREGSES